MIARVNLRLVRHGEFDGQDQDIVWGRADDRLLTRTGDFQSTLLGMRFYRDKIHFDGIDASSAKRGIGTAEGICRELRIPIESVDSKDSLRELHKGDWDGVRRDRVATPAVIARIERDGLDARPPNGETPREAGKRMMEEACEKVRLCAREESSFLSVTHTMSTLCFLADFLGLSMKAILRMKIENTSITHVRFVGDPRSKLSDGWELVTLNDHAHLFDAELLRSYHGRVRQGQS